MNFKDELMEIIEDYTLLKNKETRLEKDVYFENLHQKQLEDELNEKQSSFDLLKKQLDNKIIEFNGEWGQTFLLVKVVEKGDNDLDKNKRYPRLVAKERVQRVEIDKIQIKYPSNTSNQSKKSMR